MRENDTGKMINRISVEKSINTKEKKKLTQMEKFTAIENCEVLKRRINFWSDWVVFEF